jgi:Helicase conserved C-terminal domain
MRRDGWPALCIHGDKNQSERDWVMNEFRDGKIPILIATDVAARGLGKLFMRLRGGVGGNILNARRINITTETNSTNLIGQSALFNDHPV